MSAEYLRLERSERDLSEGPEAKRKASGVTSACARMTDEKLDFEITVDIGAPPSVVWEVMSDVERWPEWTASVRSIRRLDQGPFRIGSRALIRQPKFPPALWTVTAIDPVAGFTWRSGAPGVWVHAHHTLKPTPTGTRVRLGLRYEGFVGQMIARMTREITERYLAMEASGLKKRSEERVR